VKERGVCDVALGGIDSDGGWWKNGVYVT